MTATLTPPTERPARKLPALLPRLNRQSVEKRSDAYLDIDWDAPELAIGPDDPRCGLFEFGQCRRGVLVRKPRAPGTPQRPGEKRRAIGSS